MQTTPKARAGWSEKKSPVATPRSARRLKTESDPKSKTPKRQSPKALPDRRSLTEKRTAELECRISELEGELSKAKEELSSSEVLKREAEAVAEERKQQLMEMSASEDSRIDELRKLSQERDKVWQSELEAMQRQHAMDSAALASAMNDLQKLKAQLSESDSAPQTLVENLRRQLFDAKESEAQMREFVSATEKQLEIANCTLEMLRSDALKMSEACTSMETELEQSKSEVRSLEKQIVEEREAHVRGKDSSAESAEGLEEELNLARYEISQLRTALEVAEARYHEEYIESTLQIRSAYEQVEVVKSEYSQREVKMEEELKSSMAESEALRERLMEKEMEVQSIKSQNETKAAMDEEAEKRRKSAEATSTQLEAELKRLKVQCEQWRKAAEAAASMLSGDGKSVESPLTRNVYLDDSDEELSPKKKNGNMLRKIGVLLKKGQK